MSVWLVTRFSFCLREGISRLLSGILYPIADCLATFQPVRCGDVKLVLVPSQFKSFASLVFVAFIDFFSVCG